MSKDVEKLIKNAKTHVTPSEDFTSRVMKQIELPKKQRLNWFLAAPASAVLLLAVLGTQNYLGANPRTTASIVEDDLSDIESLLAGLDTDFLDEELADVEE